MKQHFHKEQGVTLIEVLATVALLTVIGAVTFPFLNRVFFDFQEGMEKSKLFKELQSIESQLVHVARNTTSDINGESFLQLDEANPHVYRFISAEDGMERYGFEWTDGKLVYKKDDSFYVLSNHVTSFSLREEGEITKKLVYTIQLSSKVNGKEISVGFSDRYMLFPNWDY